MNHQELQKKIISVFEKSRIQIHDNEIISHHCEECNLLKSHFKNTEHLQLQGDMIKAHFDSLPLLTPKALRYFFPNYLIYSLENPDSLVCEFTIYQLIGSSVRDSPLSQFQLFNHEELEVIKDFIVYLKNSEIYAEFQNEIDQTIETWEIH